MKGHLKDQPLAELLREILSKRLSGTLRVENERAQAAVYFEHGQVIYAASNIKTLRLRRYLAKLKLGSQMPAELQNRLSDLELAAALTSTGNLRQKDVDSLLEKLVTDVLRVALLWTEGNWEFNERARLKDNVRVSIETPKLLREAAQRLPLPFVSQRFRNPAEMITRTGEVPPDSNFLAAESFLLSRLDQPVSVDDLIASSGLPEPEAQRTLYALALSGFVKREYWQNAFRTETAKPSREPAPVAAESAPPIQQSDNWMSASVEETDLEAFLERLRNASNHYEVIELPTNAKTAEIKDAYYAMARRYHPDRFHLKSGTGLHRRLSSAFARVTQAYETLTDPNARATYDQTLKRSRQFSADQKLGKPAAQVVDFQLDTEPEGSDTERAEYNFREGFGALEQGRISAAVTHLANAARLDPGVARYRAYYGRALAAAEHTRRLAENEFQAAIKLEPNNATFRTMLGELYFDLKFHRRAQTEVDRALAIEPNSSLAHLLLRKLQKSSKVG
jgi:tetratricopeptide (TPR) repeat protein